MNWNVQSSIGTLWCHGGHSYLTLEKHTTNMLWILFPKLLATFVWFGFFFLKEKALCCSVKPDYLSLSCSGEGKLETLLCTYILWAEIIFSPLMRFSSTICVRNLPFLQAAKSGIDVSSAVWTLERTYSYMHNTSSCNQANFLKVLQSSALCLYCSPIPLIYNE